ncbi:MAG: NADH peroxidase, partial [Clostridia bacterium]|nr:NADH peroxidase [Clostridia bacterium]
MKKWKCAVCGQIVESDVRPEQCPLCKAPAEKFEELVETEMTWAAEHIVGIGKKDASEEIIEGLRANFNGECCEVGMYLAMAREIGRA